MKKRFSLLNMSERETREVKAGEDNWNRNCSCACAWASCGGSSTNANFEANFYKGPNGAHSIDWDERSIC